MNELEAHDNFHAKMAQKFPRYVNDNTRFGGFAVGEGWYPILEALIGQIDHYTTWRRRMRAYDLRLARAKAKGRESLLRFITKGKAIPSFYDEQRADDIMENDQRDITPKVEFVLIEQIKEKFGGLRFYYQGGDDHIDGMVTMAEIWAGQTCETCGEKGKRRDGGWVRTLCDKHEEEYQHRMSKFKSEDDDA
jgi:hypothetical protein